MTAEADTLFEALAPVRAALLAAARAEVGGMVADTDARAAEAVADAEKQALRIRERAREDGSADAAAALAVGRSRSHRRGRAVVLGVRREAYERLRAEAETAVAAIADEADYPAIRDILVTAARGVLGPDADIRGVDGGGIIGRLGDRSVDLSLAGFARRAADAVAIELDQP